MRKRLIAFLLLCSLPVMSQTAAAPAAKPAVKKPVVAAPAQPTAIIVTSLGNLTCVLFPNQAPLGVANFIGLATGTKDWVSPATGRKMHGVPLYNGTIFHRVIPEFMIQGGDPAGTGAGEIGFEFKNETPSGLAFDQPGRLAYANAGPDTNGSQFFITEDVEHSSRLTGGYTIFGQCDAASVEIVKKIARVPRDANDRPETPVKIVKITILHGGAPVHHAPVHKPAPKPAAATKP